MDFELKIIEFLQAGRSPFFDMAFQIISKIGTILGVVFACILFLLFRKKLCLWYLFSYSFVFMIVSLVKNTVERVRPFNLSQDIINIGDTVSDYSFPSGHVACATAIAIFVGYFLFQQYKSRGMRIGIIVSLSLYVGLVALSRMYLGKHYLTDVLAGFAISACVCVGMIVLMYFFEKEHSKRKK